MPGDLVVAQAARAEPPAPAMQLRHDRPSAIAFALDVATEAALRDGLSEVLPEGLDSRRGGIGAAVAALQKSPSPQVLIIDIGAEENPLAALAELAMCVEPDTCVLVVGKTHDLGLYRDLTRGLGVGEYLVKPITRDLVARHFAPLVRGQWPETGRQTGGRLITVTGARGGVGASVVAASLAWHFGVKARRHTMLLDADLYHGTAALLLDIDPGEGLRMAIETPERIDALLAERAAHPVADRLHVLSTLEMLSREIHYAPGAAEHLLEALFRRYNTVVGDVPWLPETFCRDLQRLTQQRIVVLTPALPAVRDAVRMLAAPGPNAPRVSTTVVLNRAGMPGGLKRAQVQEALRVPLDLVIPDLPRQVSAAVTLGEPAAMRAGPFRHAIAELARQVGAARAGDAAAAAAEPAARPRPARLLTALRFGKK
jgi:pilus assembly protein CpaE